MDEHELKSGALDGWSAPELKSGALDGWSAPQRRMRDFMALRLAGLGEGESLPEDYWSTRMQEYRQRLASLIDDLATLGPPETISPPETPSP